jgi:hypothetical protein
MSQIVGSGWTGLLYSNTRSMQGVAMFSDADHEVIDSPAALFRHLYEEHGVSEALELDPETAPVQFWLRRHAELERAQRSARRQPDPPPDPQPPDPQPPPRPEAASRPESRSPRAEAGNGPREGRRHIGFGDPLLEAMTRALVGRGHNEAAVRAAIRSFPPAGGQPGGEAGVRAAFVEPMLRSVTDHLLAPGGPSRRPARPEPAPSPPPAASRTGQGRSADPPPPREEPARPEPARPEAAWAVLWADLADTGRRPGGDGTGSPGDERDDLMAVANAVQARRRVRLLRR